MSGKLKKKFFMKPNNLFKFFVNFFTQLKIYIFPIYYSILNKKKTFYIFRKKNRARCFDIREKILFNNRYFKKNFYSKLHNKVGKLKKKFSWSWITYLNFLWIFFTQLKIYIFPIYYRILNKKKISIYFEKKIQPRCFDIREKFLFNNRYFKKKLYSKLGNMSGKLKKNFSWSRITYLNFLWNFFTQLKIYIFPIYYRILNKKKISIYFEKKIQPRCFDIREKFLFNKLRNMSGKLKKNFSWSRITYLNFLWNFFTQLKIYIFPIYYRILNKKKTFYIFRKKNPAAMLRYSRKIFVQQSLFKIFFYSKLRNMSGKLKKKIFMKPNNLFKFFVKFFYSIKNIYFPDILQHFKQKKNFLYISKKKSSLDASIFAKNFCSTIAI